ncbi:MAG: heme exporter protein CcmD [Pseudomonadota bacterium]
MPDLGPYATAVLGSYAVGLVLMAVIVAASVFRSRRIKRALDEAEARARHG